jgi:multisubunit Na+/H+ antiporter MnhC subunit
MKKMKDREVFFVISILVILIGFYMLLVKTIGVKLGDNLFHVSVISDGIFLIIMGIAMVIVSSREWDSEKRIK